MMQLVRCASHELIFFSLGSKNLRRKFFETLKERELSLWGTLEARKQESNFVLDLKITPFLVVQGTIYSQNGGVTFPLNSARLNQFIRLTASFLNSHYSLIVST